MKKQVLSVVLYRAIQNKKRNARKNLAQKVVEPKREEWKGIEPREVNFLEDLEGLTEGERKLKEL